jgi:peptidoglycan-N-acetylglucosamine deacetylase
MSLEWPEGTRSAASFTFDIDAESGLLAADPSNAQRPGVLSQARYGPRVGVPLLLDLLAQREVKGTFFIPGVVVEWYPETVQQIIEGGHEVALHGYTHTPPARLPREQEEEELEKAYELLTGAGGTVTGYRSPSWDVSPHTLDLLEAKGLIYTSQFMDDFRPYRHRDRRLVELPVQWILDDWPHFAFSSGSTGRICSAADVEVLWKEEFDGIHSYGGSYILTMHPQISGRPARVALVGRMIDYVQRRTDVWVATCAEIAAYANERLPRAVRAREA